MTTKPLLCVALAGSAALLSSGCSEKPQVRAEYSMGEHARVGQVTYSVIESAWRTQLGESFKSRTPENRFLLIKISVTNGTGKDVSVPLLALEGNSGQSYPELADGAGVDNWFGVLRTISPGQTQQGNILFDVPLTSYKLRLPDLSDSDYGNYASVQIPLRIDAETPIQTPLNPDSIK